MLGGIEALILRLQLAQPNSMLLTPGAVQPAVLDARHDDDLPLCPAGLSGFSNYLWPLLLGSRDMALPRLNAFSYWIYLCAGIFLYAGFAIGSGPNDGWFNYVPYAAEPYNPGPNIDFYSLGMILFGISTTVGAHQFCRDLLAHARARACRSTACRSWSGER